MLFEVEDELPRQWPKHWIGVEADWADRAADPSECLVSLPPSSLRTHALIVGATGSGKTTLLHHLIAQDVLESHSLCILDLRGDLVHAAVELCADRVDPQLVQIIDLREKQSIVGFNPLYGKGEPYFRALNVLDAVAAEAESWGVQLAESLRLALLALAEAGEPLPAIEALFFDRAYRLSVLDRVLTRSTLEFWQRFDAMSIERQAALAMPVLNKVSLLLATENLRKILGHPQPFDLSEHLDTAGSLLLVSLAVDELHGAARMVGSLFLAAICREIFARVEVPESKRNPVRLYIDEFEHFGSDIFETILAEGRRFKLSAVLAHQTLSQVGPKLRSLILGNAGVKVLFRLGREDTATFGKDIFGNGSAFDFTQLPVGYGVVWTRNLGAVEVEMNEPLVPRGGMTAAAQEFVRCVYSRTAMDASEITDVHGARGDETPSPAHLTSNLEDFLCG